MDRRPRQSGNPIRHRPLRLRPAMYRFDDHFRLGHCGGIQGRPAPRYFEWKTREVHDTAVAAEAAQVVRRTHENTVRWARLGAHCAKNALRVVDGITSDTEALAFCLPFLADVYAIDWTRPGTTIACDTAGQVVSVEAAVSCADGYRLLRVDILVGEGTAILPVGYDHVPYRDPHPLRYGRNRNAYVSKPF